MDLDTIFLQALAARLAECTTEDEFLDMLPDGVTVEAIERLERNPQGEN